MFITKDPSGATRVILDAGESVIVELPGGNGEEFTIGADDKSVQDEDGFNLTEAYWSAS